MATETSSKLKIPLIGLLAVKNLFITKEELQKGVVECAAADNPDVALKEYFLSNELISSQNMARLLRAAKALEIRQQEFKFGAIAIRKGFINQSVLKLALEEQESDIKNKRKIRLVGDLLVEAGLLTEKQQQYILKLQQRIRTDVEKAPEKNQSETAEGDGEKIAEKPDLQGGEEKIAAMLEPEIITGGIKLQISKDFMGAFLSKTDGFDNTVTLLEIKEVLFEKGIVLGLADDKMIEGFINSSGFKTKAFRVAKGISPIQGKDAKVEFFFNTDYLKAGGMSVDGAIDFKDRGQIPHVGEGTVLAEKIAMVESRRGHTIYGDEIETIQGNDILLKCGKGAKLSEDGFKILAAVDGFPKYTLSGHVFVHQEYITEGDVDYETGHINYDGNVTIKGQIKSGFKVNGNDITAIELDGGIINADGDVKIVGGINEGKIYARGNVYAKFIHKSEVVCMGNVIVQKEIVDSDIECSGSCIAESGKIISSRIAAKMGVKARDIGTEMATPNVLKVGHDVFTEKELEKNKEKIENLKKQIAHHKDKKDQLKTENLVLQKQITELAHVQDRSQLEEKDMNSKISSMEKETANAESIQDLKKAIEQLKLSAKKAEENLDVCFNKSDTLEEMIENEDKEIAAVEKRLEDFQEERKNLTQWAKDNPGKPVVIVAGAILPGTLIRGQHSEKRISEAVRHSRIMEVLCTSSDGQSLNIYEMQVGNI